MNDLFSQGQLYRDGERALCFRERPTRTGADQKPAHLAREGEEHTRRNSVSLYTVILFLHIVGAIGYFLGIGLWLFILLSWRRTQCVEQVRSLLHLNDLSAPFAAASAVLLLGTGLSLALTAWSLLTSWILVALI